MNFSRIMRKCRIIYRYLQTKRDCVQDSVIGFVWLYLKVERISAYAFVFVLLLIPRVL